MQTVTVKRWRVGAGPQWRTTVTGPITQAQADVVSRQAGKDKLDGEAVYVLDRSGIRLEVSREV